MNPGAGRATQAGSPGERDLVDRAAGGDPEAFHALVLLYQDRIYGLVLRILRSPEDAEEAAQEAFVRAWRGLPAFRRESAFSTWLYRIAFRRALDWKERRAARQGVEAALEVAADPEGGAAGSRREEGSEMAEAFARARRLESLMARLTPVQRGAITLFYYEGRSVEEVAAILQVPRNTVKTHLSRARAALRDGWLRQEMHAHR